MKHNKISAMPRKNAKVLNLPTGSDRGNSTRGKTLRKSSEERVLSSYLKHADSLNW